MNPRHHPSLIPSRVITATCCHERLPAVRLPLRQSTGAGSTDKLRKQRRAAPRAIQLATTAKDGTPGFRRRSNNGAESIVWGKRTGDQSKSRGESHQ